MIQEFKHRVHEYFPLITLCLVVFAFYQTLIYSTSTIYWNDAHIRLALRNQLFLGEWLPGVQVFVFLISKITSDLNFLQSVLSLLSIGTLISFYILARYIFSFATGLVAFVLLAFNSMFVAFAIVPYSEILFIGFVCLIFILLDESLFSKRFYFGIFLLNLASLTRYEGWFLAVFFILEVGLRSFQGKSFWFAIKQMLKMAFWCSLAPVVWLMTESGGWINRLNSIFQFVIAPSTSTWSDHVLARLNIDYILDFSSQFFKLLAQQIHVEFLVFAMFGILFATLNPSHRSIHFRILLFVILDWMLLAFFQPWKFGSLRQPFLLQVFLILYAAYGLTFSASWFFLKISLQTNWTQYLTIAISTILALRIIPSTFNFIITTSSESDFLVPYKIAKWLEPRLTEHDAILIIDDTDYYPYALAAYFEYPLDFILDDRLEAQFIQQRLAQVESVYIIELYKSTTKLSLAETRILDTLKNTQFSKEQFIFDGVKVWYVLANEISYSP